MRDLERAHAAIRREIAVENDELRIGGGQLEQRLTVDLGDELVARSCRTRPSARFRLALQRDGARLLERRHTFEAERREAKPT